MIEGQLPLEKPQEEPNPAWWDDGDPQFCGQLDRNTDLRDDPMNRTIYKVTRRLAPALTVVYRAMQIVRLLISW